MGPLSAIGQHLWPGPDPKRLAKLREARAARARGEEWADDEYFFEEEELDDEADGLPAVDDGAVVMDPTGGEEEGYRGRVLVVVGDEEEYEVAKRLLEKRFYVVERASDGPQVSSGALSAERIRWPAPSCVSTDARAVQGVAFRSQCVRTRGFESHSVQSFSF